MIYKVRANFKTETAADYFNRLYDGTIQNQRPDGQEIVNAMKRAIVTADKTVEWSEKCYCSTPLAHERATVLDNYFDILSTEEIDAYQTYDGQPFLDYLKQLVAKDSKHQ